MKEKITRSRGNVLTDLGFPLKKPPSWRCVPT